MERVLISKVHTHCDHPTIVMAKRIVVKCGDAVANRFYAPKSAE
jgi:hypothetical protein